MDSETLNHIPKFIFESFKSYSKYNKTFQPEIKQTILSDHTKMPGIYKDIMSDSMYAPGDVVKPDKMNEIYKYESNYDDTQIEIFIVRVGDSFPKIKRYINLIHMYTYLLNKVKHIDRISIALAFFDDKKLLPKKTIPLAPVHVNSGVRVKDFTQSCIFVFRNEEDSKVILHELMHHYGMDFYNTFIDNEVLLRLKTKINIHTKRLALHETYNDTMTILYVIGLHILVNEQNITLQKYLQKYSDAFDKATQFMLMNACKLLRYYNKKRLFDDPPILEKTHVLTYYFGKALTFSTINEFNSIIPKTIAINDNAEHVKKFADYFVKHMLSKEFDTLLARKTTELTKVQDTMFLNTLRMSNLDI